MFQLLLSIVLLAQAADVKDSQQKWTGAELIKNSKANDWRKLDDDNTLYMELKTGRVTIELAPDFAPKHVKNIKQIVKNRYWDDLVIMRSQDNYVVQWGYPGEGDEFKKRKNKLKKVKKNLNPEFESDIGVTQNFIKLPDPDTYAPEVGFSKGFAVGRDSKSGKAWMVHCYGAVGVSRDTDINSGSGTSLYVVTGHAPRHLDRNITLVGRVVSGMEHLTTLPRGKGALGFYQDKRKYVPIKSVRLATDMPQKKREKIELMRTDTELFKRYLESRRNRYEEWFYRPTGRIEICNIPRVVRPI